MTAQSGHTPTHDGKVGNYYSSSYTAFFHSWNFLFTLKP